jgi:hypothetical protein
VLGVAITLGAVMVIIIPQTDFLCNARIWLFNIGLQVRASVYPSFLVC